MTCDSVAKLIPLYFYGELMPEEEDRLEEHLHDCAACTRELERQRALAAALDQRQAEVPPALLEDCRADLLAAIQGGAPRFAKPAKGPWTLFLEALAATLAGFDRYRTPVGAVALVAIGFFAARFTGTGAAGLSLSPADEVFSTVRSVQPDNSGRVQSPSTKRAAGGLGPHGRSRHPAAAAGRRARRQSRRARGIRRPAAQPARFHRSARRPAQCRVARFQRRRAPEGPGWLEAAGRRSEVRKTLAQVLLADDNPAVRMQVVDLLVAHRDDYMVGVLQSLVQKEDNNYVRLKCEKALKDMNASIGTF